MPKKEKLTPIQRTGPNPAEYLRKLSQHTQNIKTIIDMHLAKSHYYNKELCRLYNEERNNFLVSLVNPIGVNAFPFLKTVLSEDLIENDGDTKGTIAKLKLAKAKLTLLLANIQREREKSPDYKKAKTGLERGPLRDYLFSLIDSGKKTYNKNVLCENENLIIKNGDEY